MGRDMGRSFGMHEQGTEAVQTFELSARSARFGRALNHHRQAGVGVGGAHGRVVNGIQMSVNAVRVRCAQMVKSLSIGDCEKVTGRE